MSRVRACWAVSSLSVGWWTRLGVSLLSLVDPSFAYDSQLPASASSVSPSPAAASVLHHQHEPLVLRPTAWRRTAGSWRRRAEAAEAEAGAGRRWRTSSSRTTRRWTAAASCGRAWTASSRRWTRCCSARLDRCLHAAHMQYAAALDSAAAAAAAQALTSATLALPSLRARVLPASLLVRCCCTILTWHTYAAAAFHEFRSLVAAFRRVQSQLSPSLAVANSSARRLPAAQPAQARQAAHSSSRAAAAD